uniref:TraY domain-containing protein n=1 Tax=Methylorubrum thiocyanatum TaxID=47958 RepID=UPI00398C5087
MKRRAFPKGTGERISLSTRTTAAIRDRLEEAAQHSGRSLSQEMEFRLAESFMADDIVEHSTRLVRERELPLVDNLGGPETFSLLEDIASLAAGVEADQGKRWFESPELRAQLFKVLEAALPELLRADRGP